ncbi:DUF4105 domain-containing protein [Vibrio ostreicida]
MSLLLGSLFSAHSQANVPTTLMTNADALTLSNDKIWLTLLHYQSGLFGKKSAINSEHFFIAENGHQDAHQELLATLSLFYTQPESQCRFPARRIWLLTRLDDLELPQVECTDYQQFKQAFAADSVSLVYASGYLGNPASMYGHVLLKFNRHNNHELLDNTFSYGARVPDDDNKLTYIYKGIAGGYQGYFTNQKYHHQSLTYNESELRDLWEYRLKLSQQDIDFLLAHLLELENASMTYYFFTENCAYQLARLLELTLDRPLIVNNKLWMMPYDVIMMLNQPDTTHYVEDVIYHASRQEQLYNRFSQLSALEQDTVFNIASAAHQETLALLNSHDDQSKKRIIDTLYDYYAFVEQKNDGLSADQNQIRKLLLSERFGLPSGAVSWKTPSNPPPHQAQDTALVQVSPLYNEALGSGITLRFRANYYDLLNLNAARVPHSALNTLDLKLVRFNQTDRWHLRELTLFEIVNLNYSQTGLPEDQRYAWGLSAGYKPTSLSCNDCSDTYISGFVGQSLGMSEALIGYLAVTGELQINTFHEARALSGAEIGGVWTVSPNWVTSIKLGSQYYINDIAQYKNYLKWEQRFFANRSFDVRTSVNYDDAFEYSAHFSLYW